MIKLMDSSDTFMFKSASLTLLRCQDIWRIWTPYLSHIISETADIQADSDEWKLVFQALLLACSYHPSKTWIKCDYSIWESKYSKYFFYCVFHPKPAGQWNMPMINLNREHKNSKVSILHQNEFLLHLLSHFTKYSPLMSSTPTSYRIYQSAQLEVKLRIRVHVSSYLQSCHPPLTGGVALVNGYWFDACYWSLTYIDVNKHSW